VENPRPRLRTTVPGNRCGEFSATSMYGVTVDGEWNYFRVSPKKTSKSKGRCQSVGASAFQESLFLCYLTFLM